jgi:multidrug efflux pump subunit AcrB
MMSYLLGAEMRMHREYSAPPLRRRLGPIRRVHHLFNAAFERLRYRYMGLLNWVLHHRAPVLACFILFAGASLALTRLIGQDFFPDVDSGQMRLHARGHAGLRIEETETKFAALEREIRSVIPARELDMLIDNIGIPNSWPAIAQGDIPTISSADGEILISLNKENHRSAKDYEVLLRRRLRERFPDMTFFFQPANITTQIVNFGLPAPIDLQVVGRNAEENYKVAQRVASRIAAIPGAVDVHVHQVVSQPTIQLNIDRAKASQLGLTQRDVTNNMLMSLTGSGTVAPNYWLNWANGVNYNVAVQTPQYRVDSLDALLRTPIASGNAASGAGSAAAQAYIGASPNGASQAYGNPGAMAGGTQLLSNLVDVSRTWTPVIVNHYNVWPVFDIYANVDRRDLGGVGAEIEKIMKEEEPKLSRGTFFDLRGQLETMKSSFLRLELGMLFAVALVYLLMTVNFQSWVDPFIILTALPGAVAGILWCLFVTGTTLSVPSLMGSIMCIGVAAANSILMVTFANDSRESGVTARDAVLAAGHARVRPVLMTATAMILGMLPMALGIGEGAEQNAPLGRAVIGGLLFATVTTLFIVPVVYTYLRRKPPVDHERRLKEREREAGMSPELLQNA